MKKSFYLLMTGATLLVAAASPGFAETDGTIYGTMKIPYNAFYAAEGTASEVDAVSSATDSKWKNDKLVGGTYYEEHTDDNIDEEILDADDVLLLHSRLQLKRMVADGIELCPAAQKAVAELALHGLVTADVVVGLGQAAGSEGRLSTPVEHFGTAFVQGVGLRHH